MNTTAQSSTTPAECISDWPGSPLSTMHNFAPNPVPIPIEQYPDDSSYVIRLEVPGIDPARDLRVSIETGTLTVQAERRGPPEGSQSEFRYGTLARHVALPLGANVRDVSASYRNGILTVRIGMEPEHLQGARAIDVSIEP